MSNDLQSNLGYFMMINYDNFSLCHLADIFSPIISRYVGLARLTAVLPRTLWAKEGL